MTEIARTQIEMFVAVRWRKILEQLYFVPARRFHHCQFQLGAFYSGDLLRPFACLMRAVRKFKPENVPPKHERSFEIRDGNASVIRGDDSKRGAHLIWKPGTKIKKLN